MKFLICLNHFHRIIYRKPCCKVGIFLSIVSDKLAGLESSAEKVQHFQKYCRIHYKEFVNMYPFLRSVAKKTKTKNGIKKKMAREEFKEEIGNFKEIKNLHYCLLNVLNLI